MLIQELARVVGWRRLAAGRRSRFAMAGTLVPALALLAFGAAPVGAQTQNGSVGGYVKAADGTAIVEAVVHVVGGLATRDTRTDLRGYYYVPSLPPGQYVVTVEKSDMTPLTYNDLVIYVGAAARVDFDLQHMTKVSETVIVTAVAPLVENAKTRIDTVINTKTLEDLPIVGRNFLDSMRILPGVTQGNSGVVIAGAQDIQKNYNIDGVDNIDLAAGKALAGGGYSLPDNKPYMGFDQESIQELSVATGGYGAEQGFGSGGLINVVTKSGTNILRGSGYLTARNNDWDYKSPTPYESYMYGGSLGGPIRKDKVFFFVNPGVTWSSTGYDNRTYLYKDVPSSTENVTKAFNSFGKVSWVLPHGQTLTASVNAPWSRNNRWIVLFRSPKDYVDQTRKNTGVLGKVSHTALLGPMALLESTISYGRTKANSSIPEDAHSGFIWSYGDEMSSSGGYGADRTTKDKFFWAEKLTYQAEKAGHHTISTGFDVRWNKSDDWRAPSQDVTYYNYPDYPIAYSISDQAEYQLALSQSYIGAYLSDMWRLANKLTFNLGVRVSRDSFLKDVVVEPRFGLAYDPVGNGKTVIRGGANLYYDRINMYAQQLANYPMTTEIMGFADGSTYTTPAAFRSYQIDPNVKNPRTTEYNIGLDRQLFAGLVASVSYIYRKYDDELFTEYTNLVNEKTGLRPDPTRGAVTIASNAGWADYKGLLFSVRKAVPGRYQLLASYSYQGSKGNCFLFDNFSQLQMIFDRNGMKEGDIQPSDLSGKTEFDKPYDIKTFGSINLPLGFLVSGVAAWTSGTVYTDYDGQNRVMVSAYQGMRSPYVFTLDLKLQKDFKLGGARKIAVMLEAFNATNRKNVLQVQADVSDPSSYGTPYDMGESRRIQLGTRFTF